MSQRSSVSKKHSVNDADQSVLDAAPRAGGFLNVSPELVNYQSESLEYEDDKNSCTCFGVDSDTETTWEDASTADNISLASVPPGGDFNVIGNVITVIMLLASGNDPTDFQLKTAADYLECIKDDDGSTPPNIQGLLNHIHMVQEEREKDDGEKSACASGSGKEDNK